MNFDSSFLSPEKMDNWELYSAAIKIEMRQCRDEGKDIAQYEKLAEAIAEMERTPIREELANVLYKALMDAPIKADFPFIEPNDLEDIRAARPADRMQWQKPEKNEALRRTENASNLHSAAVCEQCYRDKAERNEAYHVIRRSAAGVPVFCIHQLQPEGQAMGKLASTAPGVLSAAHAYHTQI